VERRTRYLLALLTDVAGGRIRMTRTRLIVGLITPHHIYLTITKTRKGRPRPDQGCSATDDNDDDDVERRTDANCYLMRSVCYE
jgi:hypothetical protein